MEIQLPKAAFVRSYGVRSNEERLAAYRSRKLFSEVNPSADFLLELYKPDPEKKSCRPYTLP